ncbi:MAG: HRDC domain-containing protein [Planctomycetota bacterium]|nr:ribonuclease D [Planctomycetaceae bacterium]MDQ3330690.1 HRDC domain-containing protein [Planctomycetota bacterium]
MPERLIVDQAEFDAFCEHARAKRIVAFDSEFVAEYTYSPELCLLQFATDERLVGVDPYKVQNLSAWWDVMADPDVTVVVHGGQAEIRFCLELSGRKPVNLVDVQLAEGLRGRSYPLAFDSLVARVLGQRMKGKETRTDWRQRPLSAKQIEYALDDVEPLLRLWDTQRKGLDKRGRLEWAIAEFARMIEDIAADMQRPAWHRLPSLHRLSPREFAAAMELATWRENEAKSKNRPVRKMLRDDLVVELARRQPKTIVDLAATRDMNRGDYRRYFEDMLACLDRVREIPKAELPKPPEADRPDTNPDEHVLGQLLGIALSSLCAEKDVARTLVGTSADLRHLVRWHLYGEKDGDTPKLARGWRAELCGDLLTDVMDGKIAMRVADPNSDHPLVFERSEREE